MKAVLRKMTPEEFTAFCAKSVTSYAADLMRDDSLSETEALRIAEEEFQNELPKGTDTPDHFPMTVLSTESGCPVGIIWYMYEWTNGVRQVFLNDLLIDEPHRRQGFASAALRAMEQNAAGDGCTESVLYVWNHNPAGSSLYAKAGYLPFREEENGRYMKKSLC